MVRFLIKAVFGGETLIIGKGLLQGGAYFDLIVKWWGTHLTSRVYRDAPLRRFGDVPLRRRWVFHLGRSWDVTGTYRETSLRRRHDVLMPGGKVLDACSACALDKAWNFANLDWELFLIAHYVWNS